MSSRRYLLVMLTFAVVPTIDADAAPAPQLQPVAGTYACTHDYWTGAFPNRMRQSDPVGALTMRSDGSYRWLDDGGGGKWTMAVTGDIRFLTGPVAAKRPRSAKYTRNARTSQIDIEFNDEFDWSCGRNL